MKMKHQDQSESDLPEDLAAPARRALIGAGYWHLEQLNGVPAAEIRQLHGMGPKAMEKLRQALAKKGMSLAE